MNSGIVGSGRARAPREPWPRVKLGEVCEEIRARVSSAEVGVDAYVTTDNMLKNCAGITRAEYVPEDVGLVCYQKGDVLLANIRPYLKKLWRADRDGGCSSDVVVFRSCREDLSSEYLFAALSQDRFFDYVMQKPRGTKMPRGDRDWMKEFSFPLPPLPVQRSIVAQLERELGAVEKVTKAFEELECAADGEFMAELKETFESFGSGEPGVFALPSGRTRTPAAPHESWSSVKLGDVCEFRRGLTYSKKDEVDQSDNVVLRSNNVDLATGRLDLTELKYISDSVAIPEEKKAKYGSLLMCMANGSKSHLGKVALVDRDLDYAFGGFMGLIVPNSACILGEYLYWGLSSYEFKKLIAGLTDGANINNLKFADIEEFSFSLPPLPVQREIVARLDAARERKDRLVSAAKRGREAAALWRKAILKEAFE